MEDLENKEKKDIKNDRANMKNRKQKLVLEKMPPTYGTFHQNVKRAHLKSLIFNKADKAFTEIKNLNILDGSLMELVI